MADDLDLRLDMLAVGDIADGRGMESLLQDIGDEVASRARATAARNTGAGAASIHAEVHRGAPASAFASGYAAEGNELTAYVSWDQEHFYMLFVEEGTENMPAQPAVRPALEQVRI